MISLIVYRILVEQGTDNPALWAGNVANSWRTTQDISDNWISMLNNIDIVRKFTLDSFLNNFFLNRIINGQTRPVLACGMILTVKIFFDDFII